ncbi:MAG: hypothetical protein COW00_11915 [Bdellovibrio sp. CG12_big_fil_rev_8_21_14_0_65_39_13]|nr:MAG: hypothetical protein COW78_00710 [Bdellovibrio sp. CG22_combo_CG10-13_8_21_14_all_39_27]PIQ59160.1 MAG: hypothetical protein COW00_11915 [Bdellovibrio sp. CG12_big_fil_rev_8_21_14_0_65_39_13]PIR33300.1 MAG: hypothetical protein COV37_16705 [Bdellovibrio sp. CG11_big_fil_rev_8_21_14_0_20_39_38]
MDLNEINSKLESIAYSKSMAFCYSCYKEAPTGTCKSCHSDDLMRLLPDSGCEYGVDWIVKELIEENLNFVDSEEVFEQMIEDCYEETTQVGFMRLSTVQVMKDQDPIGWDIAKGEYIDGLAEDGQLITFNNGSSYYWIHDVELYIEENLDILEEAC